MNLASTDVSPPFSALGSVRDQWCHHVDDVGAMENVMASLDDGPGFAVLTGVAVSPADLADAKRRAIDLGRAIGQPIWQDNIGTLAWLVRDEGHHIDRTTLRLHEGRSSLSSAAVPFHTDGATGWLGEDVDVMLLLMVQSDSDGGDSILLDSYAVYQALLNEDPEAMALLSQPLPFDRSTTKLAEQSPIAWLPMFSWERSTLRARINTWRVRASIANGCRVRSGTLEALDTVERIMDRPEHHVRFHLESGDCLFVNERRVAHAREAFFDPGRTLVRVWLHRPPLHLRTLSWPMDFS